MFGRFNDFSNKHIPREFNFQTNLPALHIYVPVHVSFLQLKQKLFWPLIHCFVWYIVC